MSDHDHDADLPLDAWTLESLLDGRPVDDPTQAGVAELEAWVAAVRGPATEREVAGAQAAVAAFSAVAADLSRPVPDQRRSSVLSPLLGSKLALGIAVGAVALGGTSAAAFTANLPAPAQNAAHRLLGAPTAETSTTEAPEQDEATPTTTPTATSSATPVGPDATGSAAFGLCTAWTAQQADGATTNPTAVAFRNLATAAGGAANVPAYCATVVHPGSAMSHPTGSPTTHPNARPTSHPTGSPTTHPKARSTSHPTGSPATHPAGRPSGHPANR